MHHEGKEQAKLSSNKAKIACIHITQDKIYLLEGRLSSGILLVTRTAAVNKASRFFHNGRLAFMTEMVSSIINAMQVNSFQSKQVQIVYDNGLNVDFFLNEQVSHSKRDGAAGLSRISEMDISSIFKKNENDATRAQKGDAGTIRHRQSWGVYVTEADAGEMFTTVSAERDLVEYMVSEFQTKGYKVLSIEPPETALFYLRKFAPFTYDALNKLVVHADDFTNASLYQFTKDMPSGQRNVVLDADDKDGFIGVCVETIKEEISREKLRNPYVMFVGKAFKDEDMYVELCDALKYDGISVVDIYGLWKDHSQPLSMIRTAMPTVDQGIDIELNGPFGICIAMMLRQLEAKPENLVEGFHPMFLDARAKRDLSGWLKTFATIAALYTVIMAVVSGYEVYTAHGEARRASEATTYQLSIIERERDATREKLEALSTIDERFDDIFKFVYVEVSNDLNIASVDTINMIPVADISTSVYGEGEAQPTETEEIDVTAETTGMAHTMQTIVIRGYSRTSDGPVELYRDLTSAGMGEVKIIGIEQVPLPSGETIFAFEMTVGSN